MASAFTVSATDVEEWKVYSDANVTLSHPASYTIDSPESTEEGIVYGIATPDGLSPILRVSPSLGLFTDDIIDRLTAGYKDDKNVSDTSEFEVAGFQGLSLRRTSEILGKEYESSEYYFDDGRSRYSLIFTYPPEESDTYRQVSGEIIKSVLTPVNCVLNVTG